MKKWGKLSAVFLAAALVLSMGGVSVPASPARTAESTQNSAEQPSAGEAGKNGEQEASEETQSSAEQPPAAGTEKSEKRPETGEPEKSGEKSAPEETQKNAGQTAAEDAQKSSSASQAKKASAVRRAPSSAVYGIWDDAKKAVTFSAEKPESGDFEQVTDLKAFLAKHRDAKTIDFSGAGRIPVSDASGLFEGSKQLREIRSLSSLDVSSCTHFSNMFRSCAALETLDVSGLDFSSAEDMTEMFSGCGMKSVNLAGMDTGKVTGMSWMFFGCGNLKNVDVSSFDTSKVSDMSGMFQMCASLQEIDLSHFRTDSLGSRGYASAGDGINCVSNILAGCSSLEKADISGLHDGAHLKQLAGILSDTPNLKVLVLGREQKLRLDPNPYPGFKMKVDIMGLSGTWMPEGGDPSQAISADKLYTTYDPKTMAGTWVRTDAKTAEHYYRTDGTLNADNLWETHYPDQRFKGYCINLNYYGVGTYLDRENADSDEDIIKHLCSSDRGSTHGFAPLGSSMKEAMITLIYYGWPNDGAGIQKKYGLTNDRYMEITQQAIWDFTDRYASKAGPSHFSGDERKAYDELLAQRYANIGTHYDLYLYYSRTNERQNLLSIHGLTDQIYGGVEVQKVDENRKPLQGAVFTVYDSQGNKVGEMTTRESGLASICPTDSYMGLPAGTYTVKETKAPAGYHLGSQVYTFTIRNSNQIVTLGRAEGSGSDEPMVFTDGEDIGYKGGGLLVQKMSDTNEPLEGAEFTIYDAQNKAVQTIRTNAAGIARTGLKDLPLGTYTVKETKAPAGYTMDQTPQTVEVTENGAYSKTVPAFTDSGKSGSITLAAKKTVEGGSLKAGEYTFQLQDSEGAVLQEAVNDADGTVSFKPIQYGPGDLGYVNYKIVETAGTQKNTRYDRHAEQVTVMISDDPSSDTLKCQAVYDADGAAFVNKKNAKSFPVSFTKKALGRKTSLAGAAFRLEDESGRVIETWTSAGEAHTEDLYPGTYKLIETAAPYGYESGDPITFVLKEDGSIVSDTFGAASDGEVVMRDRPFGTASFRFRKTDGRGKALEGAVFRLTGSSEDGEDMDLAAGSDADGQVVFRGLPAGTYTLKETGAPAGFQTSDRIWTVKVSQETKTAGSSNLDENGNQKKNADGSLMTYPTGMNPDDQGTVKMLPEGQTRQYPYYFYEKKVSIPGAQSLTVVLDYQLEDGYDALTLADGQGKQEARVSSGLGSGEISEKEFRIEGDTVGFTLESDPYTSGYGFFARISSSKIDVTDQDGKAVSMQDGEYQFANDRLLSVPVTKVWENDDAADRPDSVAVDLYQTSKEGRKLVRTGKIEKKNGWAYIFTGLPAADFSGNPITYSVEEHSVEGYTSKVSGSQEEGFNITNTKKPEKPGKPTPTPEKPDSPDQPDSGTKKSGAAGASGMKKTAVQTGNTARKTTGSLNTGDSADIGLWSVLLLSCLAAVGAAVIRRKRTE